MSHLSHADCQPVHIILASLKLASIRKWRGGSHILFLRQEATDRRDLRKIHRSNTSINTSILRPGNGSDGFPINRNDGIGPGAGDGKGTAMMCRLPSAGKGWNKNILLSD